MQTVAVAPASTVASDSFVVCSICANVGEPAFGPRNEAHGSVPKGLVGTDSEGRLLNATMFRWRDPVSSEDLLVLYHQSQHDNTWDIPLSSTFDTYGGYTRPDNMLIAESGVALASFIGSDNTGPPLTTWEVKRIFNKVQSACLLSDYLIHSASAASPTIIIFSVLHLLALSLFSTIVTCCHCCITSFCCICCFSPYHTVSICSTSVATQ